MTPAEHAVALLLRPIGCGWKGCEDVVFGVQPSPLVEGAMQGWERGLAAHDTAVHHRFRKIRYVEET